MEKGRLLPHAGLASLALACLLAGLSTTASDADAPALSMTSFLPGDLTVAPAAGAQLNPEIAPGVGGYLVVWVDERTGITEMSTFFGGPAFDHHIGSSWDVYAARVGLDGSLIDQTPIVVAQQIQNQGVVDVAWNGQNWLVTWAGQTGLSCCPNLNRYAARVSPGGVVLDPTPILLPLDDGDMAAWPATVGSDGTNWLVVAADRASGGGFVVKGFRIAADGSLLDPSGVVLHSGGAPGDFDLVFAGGEFFLVWSDGGMTSGGAILGRRLTPALTPVGGPIVINLYSPSVARNSAVATNGTDYFVTWWEDRWYGWSQLAGARVSHAASVLDPGGIFLTAANGYTNYEPAAAWDGTHYVVTYDRYDLGPTDLFAARITPTGQVLDYDTDALAVSTAPGMQAEGAIAGEPGGGGVFVAWRDARHSTNPWIGVGDIFASTVTSNGAVGPDRCLSLGAPRQTLLRLIPNGSGYLAVFRSEISPETRIKAQRLDAGGAAIDLEPVTVAAGGSEVTNPSAAWNGSAYLVVWEDAAGNRIYGRRLAPDLTPIDGSPLALLPGNTPDVAAIGDVFLVVSSREQPHEIRQIYSQRVRGSDGAVLDLSPRAVGPDFSLVPRVAALANRWLVVWERHPTHDDPGTSIQANFVAADGNPGSYFVAGADGELPAVAARSDQAWIVWEDTDIGTSGLEVFASRLLADGSFLPTVQVTAAANSQFDGAVAWDGSEFVVAYGDFRNDGPYDSHRGDLYAERIADTGIILDPGGFEVMRDTIPEMFPAVAGSGGAFVVGGSRFREESGYLAYRIGIRSSEQAVAVPLVDHLSEPIRLAVSPTPTAGHATVEVRLEHEDRATVGVFDLSGREVRRLHDGRLPQGPTRLEWDGRDSEHRSLAPGVFFVRLRTTDRVATARLVRL